jgi:hypothetical protein
MRHLDLVFNGGGHQLGEDEFHIPAQARNLLPMDVPPLLLPSMALLPLWPEDLFKLGLILSQTVLPEGGIPKVRFDRTD